jgi:cyclopropane-fatty-acyl-phospholipid synthase
MLDNIFQDRLRTLLEASSISINGNRPWDIKVHDQRFFRKVLLHGNLGLGESYMDGWWDCDDLDELFFRILSSHIDSRMFVLRKTLDALNSTVRNLQTQARAFTVGKEHYDTGNDLFGAMLDSRMMYSCAYWPNAKNLDEAQENKLRLIFDKLRLEPGMRVLDIGCGWGGAARFAAEKYGAKVVGITISREQAELARKRCREFDIDIRLMDYRDLEGCFDRIYSIGMLEHVGYKNYRTFFDTARQCLNPDGRLLIQTIGGNRPVSGTDPWISRYIFPNSMIPAISQISSSFEGKFVLEDWHSFSYDYALTLQAWHRNFTRNWPELNKSYNGRFYRMWRYYLLSCSGAFRARAIQLWQVLMTPAGIKGNCRIPHEPARHRPMLKAVNGRGNGHWNPRQMAERSGVPLRQSPRSDAAS